MVRLLFLILHIQCYKCWSVLSSSALCHPRHHLSHGDTFPSRSHGVPAALSFWDRPSRSLALVACCLSVIRREGWGVEWCLVFHVLYKVCMFQPAHLIRLT